MTDRNNTLLILAAFLLLGGGGFAVWNMTRGLRNNNPGNIEDDGVTDWEGLDTPRNDGQAPAPMLRFLQGYGVRAVGHILENYVNLDGVAPTVTALISRWAPPSENDTASYISDVAGHLGVDPDATLDIASALPALAAAITSHENGFNPYSQTDIVNWLNLA